MNLSVCYNPESNPWAQKGKKLLSLNTQTSDQLIQPEFTALIDQSLQQGRIIAYRFIGLTSTALNNAS